MNDRKKHVIKMAHQLFIEKGFQATSIQEIVECSGISKGTFYNYFSSKNELLIALFKEIYHDLEQKRNELLIGQDPSDLNIFIQQFELLIHTNKKNKLFLLFEEVLISNDEELKQFVKEGQFRLLRWTFNRFVELFGEARKRYLLDCAIMFISIVHYNMKYYELGHQPTTNIAQVIRYSVRRIERIVQEVADSGEMLNEPELLDQWLPNQQPTNIHSELERMITQLKRELRTPREQEKYIELFDFLLMELQSNRPRTFLIESVLLSLKNAPSIYDRLSIDSLEQLITSYLA